MSQCYCVTCSFPIRTTRFSHGSGERRVASSGDRSGSIWLARWHIEDSGQCHWATGRSKHIHLLFVHKPRRLRHGTCSATLWRYPLPLQVKESDVPRVLECLCSRFRLICDSDKQSDATTMEEAVASQRKPPSVTNVQLPSSPGKPVSMYYRRRVYYCTDHLFLK